MRIVVVEDELRVRHSLVKCIQKIDPEYCVVAEADNGYEGIKMILDYEPDVVITDIQMPKVDGLNMIRQVKNMNLNPVFIILSGYAEFEYAQEGVRLGIKDYLLKPITVANLRETLENVENRKETVTDETETEYSSCVRVMVETIHQKYSSHLGLELFAGMFKMSPEYLSTLFAKETGKTFSNYLKEIRMEKAKNLLQETDLKIYEIACRTGYPDQKYFSKVFKEYTGVSAKQYVTSLNSNKIVHFS